MITNLFVLVHCSFVYNDTFSHKPKNINKQKIQPCQNSSKINSNNARNRGEIDTLKTNIHDRSRSWRNSGNAKWHGQN